MSLRCKRFATLVVGVLAAAGCATASRGAPEEHLRGIRFSVDTTETSAPARGALKTFTGVVEFAAGRGRLDVSAPRGGPALAVDGVTIAAPLAQRGDYYLFDDTGFLLVRPATRTFVRFAVDSATYRHGDVRDPWDGYFSFGRLRADTIPAHDTARLAQRGPYAIRWHLDRRHATGPVTVLARGRVLLPDAPAGEASVVRWFGAAEALASLPDSVGPLPPDSVQVTAVVVLPPPAGAGDAPRRPPTSLIVLHAMAGFAPARIDPARLVLPAGYTETAWPASAGGAGLSTRAGDAGARWRTLRIPPAAMRR